MTTSTLLALALATAAAAPSSAASVPSGFVDNVLFSAAVPTGLAYEPGSGNAFVLEKGSSGTARVRRRALSGGTVTTALTLTCVDAAGERGLLGIAFDPDYLLPGSRFVYLYYTQSLSCAGAGSGSRNRVVRYLESGGVLASSDALLEGPTLNSATNHNGGTLRFAPDKTLFISMGDNDTDSDANPLSRSLADLRGKLLRINRDGSIPASNPFVGQSGKRAEIWAWGLRNPFRFTIDTVTGTPWIGDVGENAWEEIDRGVAGADYGYPCFEGDASFHTCNPAPTSPTGPVFAYGHSGTPFTGETIIGGPVYRGGNFPASYQGRLFFADYVDGWIRSAAIDPGGSSLSDIQLFTDTAGSPVDLVQAPNGCLGYVDINGPNVHEICFTGGANQAPTAVASADPTSGPAPLAVQFTGASSSDLDGDKLAFSWSFGDGASSTAANPTHTYAAGIFSAVLSVNDGQGAANSVAAAAPIVIVSGDTAPVPSIDQPAGGTHYDAGDTIAYAGSATDVDEGSIPASGLSWTIVFHHDTHTHPFSGPIGGVSSGSFTIPTSGEDATNVWFRIHLTATDSFPASSSTFVDVLPNISTITLAASPAGQGLKLSANGTQSTAPVSFDSVVNFPRTIAAPPTQSAAGRSWAFLHWSDAAASTRTIAAPASATTYTAIYRCTSGCSGLADQDGDGFEAGEGDCNDNDPAVFPGAPELCDGKNNDCTGGIDDATCAAFGGGDATMNGFDLALLGRFFGICSATSGAQPWADADLTRDGCLDGNDLALMGSIWGCSGAAPICH